MQHDEYLDLPRSSANVSYSVMLPGSFFNIPLYFKTEYLERIFGCLPLSSPIANKSKSSVHIYLSYPCLHHFHCLCIDSGYRLFQIDKLVIISSVSFSVQNWEMITCLFTLVLLDLWIKVGHSGFKSWKYRIRSFSKLSDLSMQKQVYMLHPLLG